MTEPTSPKYRSRHARAAQGRRTASTSPSWGSISIRMVCKGQGNVLPLGPCLRGAQAGLFVGRVQLSVIRGHHIVALLLWDGGNVLLPAGCVRYSDSRCIQRCSPCFGEQVRSAFLVEEFQLASKESSQQAFLLLHRVSHTSYVV